MFGKKKKADNNTASGVKETAVTGAEKADEKNQYFNDDSQKNTPLLLYVICDKATNKFKQYISNSGLQVTNVFDTIEEVRDELLLQYDPYRLVIVDTGTGKFIGVEQRKALADMIGIMEDDCFASVFYTDDILRTEVKHAIGRKEKKIHWVKYSGTADIILELSRLGEKYIGGYKADTVEYKDCTLREKSVSKDREKFTYRRELCSADEIREQIFSEEHGSIAMYEDYV